MPEAYSSSPEVFKVLLACHDTKEFKRAKTHHTMTARDIAQNKLATILTAVNYLVQRLVEFQVTSGYGKLCACLILA